MMANACLLAIQFLTRLPTPNALAYHPQALGKSVFCFPIVGILIGVILYGLAYFQPLWGTLLTSVTIVVAWLLITGGLHIDGLADTVDAWVGGHGDKDKTLRIMKDPAIGPMGTIAVLSIVLLKVALITTLIEYQHTELLIIIPALARAQLSLLLITTPYAKSTGLGIEMQRYADVSANWGLHWLILIIVMLTLGVNMFIAVLLSLFAFTYYRHRLLARLNGTTGDTAGAWVELSEVFLLFSMVTFIS